ncbi:MAG: hypothetical protein ACR2LL_04680 [Nitrosopumilus sp.]
MGFIHHGAPFGGDAVGKYSVSIRGDITSVTTSLNLCSSADTVYEGWLVDKDSGEKTSIGLIKESGQGLLTCTQMSEQTSAMT